MQTTAVSATGGIPGRKVVLAMFAFGIAGTSLIWIYWNWHVAPFMPVQMALEEQFADSSPRVEGGQRKMHKSTPTLLRVDMRVPFNPKTQVSEREKFVLGVGSVLDKHLKLADYESFELNMYQPNPEQRLVQQQVQLEMSAFIERIRGNTDRELDVAE